MTNVKKLKSKRRESKRERINRTFPMTLIWSKKQKTQKRNKKRRRSYQLTSIKKDVKKNCAKLLTFLYKNSILRKKCTIDPNDINYNAFAVIHTIEEPIAMYVYSGSHCLKIYEEKK